MIDFVVSILVFLAGFIIVVLTLFSAVRTFVLPRSARDPLTRKIFMAMRVIFNLLTRKVTTYEARDSIMALYAPITLLTMPIIWLALVAVGYTLMYRAMGMEDWGLAYKLSGSSLLTLGFSSLDGPGYTVLEFSEAAIGLILVALLIAYLPTMYTAFSQREASVAMLEVRAGSPPFGATMIERYSRIQGLTAIGEVWVEWERWFNYIEETHTSLGPLTFFRSPQPDRSWVTAAGAVLDAAALLDSTVDLPRDPKSNLCIRAGFIALRRICDFFQIPYDPNPQPGDPISVTREEYDEVYDHLMSVGIPLKPRQQAWLDYAGWRVNYDIPLLALAALTMAPYAQWVSDRSLSPAQSKQRIKNRRRHLFGIRRGNAQQV
jgi:hypothetical protein